jgi:hypothetical protein
MSVLLVVTLNGGCILDKGFLTSLAGKAFSLGSLAALTLPVIVTSEPVGLMCVTGFFAAAALGKTASVLAGLQYGSTQENTALIQQHNSNKREARSYDVYQRSPHSLGDPTSQMMQLRYAIAAGVVRGVVACASAVGYGFYDNFLKSAPEIPKP